MTRNFLLSLGLCIVLVACGKARDNGPGLFACQHSDTSSGCLATWTGAVSGSVTCTAVMWLVTDSTAWTLELYDTAVSNELNAGLTTPTVPKGGQSYSMGQLTNPEIQLKEGNVWWGGLSEFGEVSMHVDSASNGYSVTGTLSGSLVRGSGGNDGGVQICITF